MRDYARLEVSPLFVQFRDLDASPGATGSEDHALGTQWLTENGFLALSDQ